jgi:multidrug efflux system outer membrane protein
VKLLLALSLATLLGACATVGPDYQRQAPALPEAFRHLPATAQAVREAPWWTQLRDPELDRLIDETLADNRDLALATARLKEARAVVGSAWAQDLPRAELLAHTQRQRSSENGPSPASPAGNPVNEVQTGFAASWEVDLFGGIARGREAAQAEFARSQFEREAVALAVATETAGSYLRLRTAQARLTSLQAQLDTLTASAELLELRARAGISPLLDAAQARTHIATLATRRPALEVAIGEEILRLGLLSGRQATTHFERLTAAAKLPEVPALAAALPGELLARRPDLLAIERAAAAEHARIGVATSAAYPRLSLGLSLGFLAINGANLAASGSRQGSGGAQVQLPLFQGGAIRSGIEAAQARYEQARIRYETAAAVAAEEAERAALRLTRAQAREVQAQRALEAHALSARLTQARYQQGLIDYLNVLDSERQHHALDDERLLAREQAAMEWVAMVKALGGGW